jgi:hypothetical protein
MMGMVEDDDDLDSKPRGIQDAIPTVIPPHRQRRTPEVASDDGEPIESEPAEQAQQQQPQQPLSPDDVPTERPPWTDPVESREQLKPGVEPLPGAKKA